jgi:hypothetical protein
MRRIILATVLISAATSTSSLANWQADKTYLASSDTWATGPEVQHGAGPLSDATTFPGYGLNTQGSPVRSFADNWNGYDAWSDGGIGQINYRTNIAPATNDPNWSMSGAQDTVFEWMVWVDGAGHAGWPEIRMGNAYYQIGVSYDPAAQQWTGSSYSAGLMPSIAMSANAWHVVRLEYDSQSPNFKLSIDSPDNYVLGSSSGTGSGQYINWGRVVNGWSGNFYTHYAAWGQGTNVGVMGALVPEPATLGLLGLGLLLLRRGRRES